MRFTRSLPIVAVALLVSTALFARDHLERYKLWPSSPQGDFMTKAERAEWNANVKNDDQAEQFIKEFLARRPATFADDVAKRAEMADKHLTVAGQLGSRTERGKLVILLGPPQSFTIARREVNGTLSSTSNGYANAASSEGKSGGGVGSGPAGGAAGVSANEVNDISLRQMMSSTVVNDYTFTYEGDRLPIRQAKSLMVTIEVDPAAGTDKINERKTQSALDELYEAVAQASLTSAQSPAK